MDAEIYGRLVDAFVREGPERDRLEKLVTARHWRYLLGNEGALRCKVDRCEYVADLLEVDGKHVVDFGSGMGFIAGFMATRAARVTGVELQAERRVLSDHLARDLFGTEGRARFVGTIGEIEDESVDVLMLNNVISHVDRPLPVLVEMIAKIRTGGTLFIEDNNNFAAAWIRRKNRRIWARRDRRYRETRIAHLRENHPGVDAEAVADRTYGMGYEELDRAASDGGDVPYEPSLLRRRAPLDPDTGILHENAFHPHEMETILFNMGMVVTRMAPKALFDYRKRPVVTAAFRAVPRLALRVSPAFEITAVKR